MSTIWLETCRGIWKDIINKCIRLETRNQILLKCTVNNIKSLVPNYSCLQNPWLGGYRPQIPVHSVLNWIFWPHPSTPTKFLGTPLVYLLAVRGIFIWLPVVRRASSLIQTRRQAVASYLMVETVMPLWRQTKHSRLCDVDINPYPTAFPYGNGMVLHFYQQQESSTTKTVHKVINKGLKTYV